jgi:hypothetical protein
MKKFTSVLAVLALSGCMKNTVTLGGAGVSGTPDVKLWHSGLLFGLIELDEFDATEECGDKKVTAVRSSINVINSLVSGLTFNIYTASTIKIWCGKSAAEVEVPARDGAAAVDLGAALLLDAQDRQSAALAE